MEKIKCKSVGVHKAIKAHLCLLGFSWVMLWLKSTYIHSAKLKLVHLVSKHRKPPK